MAKIAAGEGFGQDIVQPPRVVASQVGNAMADAANKVENAGLVVAREEQDRLDAVDRAQTTATIGATRDELDDAVKDIDRRVQTGELAKDEAQAEWLTRSQEIAEGGAGKVPEKYRGVAQIDIQGRAKRLVSVVGDSIRTRERSETAANIDSTLEYAQRLAVDDASTARTMAFDALDNLGPHAGLTPAQIGQKKQAFTEGAAYTRAFTEVNEAKRDNAALGKVEKRIVEDKELDPQRKAQLLAQVDGYRVTNDTREVQRLQRVEIAASKAQRESDEAFNLLSGWMMAGKLPNEAANARVIAKLTPTAAAAYSEMVKEVPARAAAAMLPLDTQQRQLDALVAQRNTQGTSEQLEREIGRREKVLADAKREYADDPLRAAAERGVIPAVAPLNTANLGTLIGGLSARVEQASAVATRVRKPVSPLLPEEASKVADVLNALPPAQRADYIAQFSNAMPPSMGTAFAAQLNEKDRGLALEVAAGSAKTTSGRYTSEWIARGRQVIKDKGIKEETAAEFGLRAQIAKEVGEAVPAQWRADIIDASRLIYLGQQGAGQDASVDRAVRLALGGPLVEHNGRRLPVVAGVDLPAAVKRVTPQQLALPDGQVYLPGGKPMPAADFLAKLPSAQLEPVSPGRYAIRAGGALAMRADGTPIVIEPK